MTRITAVRLAQDFADGVADEMQLKEASCIKVRNKVESYDYDAAGAEATITCEEASAIMIPLSDSDEWREYARENGLRFEAYSEWLIAIYKL